MSQIPRAQLDQSLAVPGLAVTPPVSAGVAQAEELFRSIGMIGATVGRIGQMAEQKTASIEAGLRGQAAMDIKSQLPEFEQKIVNGELDNMFTDLGEGETVHGRVEAYLNDRLGEVPEAYREEVMKYAPTMTQALVNRQQKIIDENKAVVGATILEGTATATSPEDIQAIAEGYAEATGASVEKARLIVTGQLAELAQSTGDQRRLALLEKVSPDSATTVLARDRVLAKVAERENQLRIDQNRAVQNFSATAIEGNLDTALEDLDKMAKSLTHADEDVVSLERRRIQTAITQRNEEAFTAAVSFIDRTPGLTIDQRSERIRAYAEKFGIKADDANRLNNDWIINRAGELAHSGDVEAVAALEQQMIRPSQLRNEPGRFKDALQQAVNARDQIEKKRADDEFRVNKQRTEAAIIGDAMSAYRAGANLAAVVPSDDIVVDINGREVTYRASDMRKRIHQTAIGVADMELLAGIAGTDPAALPADQLYEAAAKKVGGPGALEARIMDNRIRLVDRTGMPDPQIKKMFATSRANSIAVGTTGQQLGPETEVLGDVFDRLDRMQLARMHMDEKAYLRFSAAKVAVTSGRAPTFNDGLVMAAHPPGGRDTMYRLDDDDFVDSVDAALSEMGVEMYVGRARTSILGFTNSAIEAGAERSAALDYAVQSFKRDHVIVDGAPVYHNGVGASQQGITELFGVLKDYAAFKEPDKVKGLPNGLDGLVMYRDPHNGQTIVHDASGFGGVILALTDEQVNTLASDAVATGQETAVFLQDIKAQDRSRRWARNEPTVAELPGVLFRTTMALANVEGHLEGKSLGSQIAPGEGNNIAISPPRPPSESEDPVVRDISRFMRQRSTLRAADRIDAPSQKQKDAKADKTLEINTRR